MSEIFKIIVEHPNIIIPTTESVAASASPLAHCYSRFKVIDIVDTNDFIRPTGLEGFRDVQPNHALWHVSSRYLWKWVATHNVGQCQDYFFASIVINVSKFAQIG